MLTQKRLKELLRYNHETGHFTWLVSTAWRIKVGDVAGSVSTCSGKKYIETNVDGERYRLHRLAFLYMTGEMPHNHVDHINGNGLDNRWINLRQVTLRENHRNTRLQSNNTSGFCGVCLDKSRNKWRADIIVDGRNKHLGYFNNIEDAIAARKAANIEHCFHPNHGSSRPL